MATVKLGQNFLVNQNVARKIVDCFLPVEGLILEVGPGREILTDLLIDKRKGQLLKVVEKDYDLFLRLKDKKIAGFEVIQADILKLNLRQIAPDGERINLISNVPYYISSEFIDWIIKQQEWFRMGVLMLQKEFVDKLMAKPNSKQYGAQGIMFNLLFKLEKMFTVQPGSFAPPPKVKSTVIKFVSQGSRANINRINRLEFYRFLCTCFQNRRKFLINNLTIFPKQKMMVLFKVLGLSETTRAEQVPPGSYVDLFHNIQLKQNFEERFL